MPKLYSKTEKMFYEMRETNGSIVSLKDLFDLKKNVLFTLNNFKKPFWLVLLFLSVFFDIANKEFTV